MTLGASSDGNVVEPESQRRRVLDGSVSGAGREQQQGPAARRDGVPFEDLGERAGPRAAAARHEAGHDRLVRAIGVQHHLHGPLEGHDTARNHHPRNRCHTRNR